MTARMAVRRIGGGLLVLWLVSLLTFLMVRLIPGDPAEVVAGDNASVADLDPIRQQLGLNRPVVEQYLSWLGGVLHGELGTSLFTHRAVTTTIVDAAPPTLALAITAIVLAVLIGVGAGVVAGLRQGGWLDRSV